MISQGILARTLRRWLPKTLKAQAVLILCSLFIVSHAVSLLLYEANRDRAVVLTEASDLAARIVGIVNLAGSFPSADRQQILAAAETQFLVRYPTQDGLETIACQDNSFSRVLSDLINAQFDELPGLEADVCVRSLNTSTLADRSGPLQGFDVLVSIRFSDNTQTVFHAVLPEATSLLYDSVVIYLIAVALVVLLLAWLLIRRAIAPLERLETAANQIGVNIDTPRLPEHGPREVVSAARAFNHMQERLARLVHGQTEMLAAISHDLRSATTRLQLRVEMLQDSAEKTGLLRVISDMRLMVDSVLAFIRGVNPAEEPRKTNITALVESLCQDQQGAGLPVTCETDNQSHILVCRPASLRRGILNVIDNAIKYAGAVHVSILARQSDVVIRVEDTGQGIPEHELEAVLNPFYRLERSRNQDTGGLGLGLAITQNIIRAHGGVLALMNRDKHGLRVEMILPSGKD
ncbi:MAG: ATP-binding protein [Pseudohongiellaceae bacterium]